MSGVPASDTSASDAPAASRATAWAGRGAIGARVAALSGRSDAIVNDQQPAGDASVLRHAIQVGRGEHVERTYVLMSRSCRSEFATMYRRWRAPADRPADHRLHTVLVRGASRGF